MSLRPSLLLVLATMAAGIARGASTTQPNDGNEGKSVVVARWYGTVDRSSVAYATREPSGFGMGLSSPNFKEETQVHVVLREEIHPVLGARTVIEHLSWSSRVSDLYYLNKDGSRVPAGTGGGGSG